MVGIAKSSESSTGYQVYLSFTIAQHVRDELLMKCLVDYFNCGKLTRKINVYEYQVFKFSDIEKFVVFFDKYPILGEKAKDLFDFCIVSDLMKSKHHLTELGALCGRISHMCLKLSNSGDTLKLLVPSYSRKVICG